MAASASDIDNDDDDVDDGDGDSNDGIGCEVLPATNRRGLRSTQLTDLRPRRPCMRWTAAASSPFALFELLPIGAPSTAITSSPGLIPTALAL